MEEKKEVVKRTMTVQEVIDALNQVEDKSMPIYAWVNSDVPEPVYTGCDRVPIVFVDKTVTGLIDICIGKTRS